MKLMTPILVYYKTTAYTPGQIGPTVNWVQYTSSLDEETTVSAFWVEWRGSHGEQSTQAMSQGVYDSATVRMRFDPTLYDLLRGSGVVIIKNAVGSAISGGAPVPSHPDCYQVWGGVDNVYEEGLTMEFKVRRWEDK